MKKFYAFSFIMLATLSFGQTPIPLIGVNVPYYEDFSGMGSAQTDLLPGWTAINISNGAPLSMIVTAGNSSTGNVYNVGPSGSEERAFGLLADASIVPAIGAVFTNSTGGTVSKIPFHY